VSPTERRVVANGLSHHVMAWGPSDGPAIVLAHGWADCARSFTEVAEVLAARGRRVVAFDWRGFGETDWVSGGGYYHFPDYALDLEELIAALGIDRFALVGHSMGGTASAMFAGTRPRGLVSLVLAEGLGPPASSDGYDRRLREWIDGVRATREKPQKVMASLTDATARLRVQHPDLSDVQAARIVPRLVRAVEGGYLFSFDPLHKTRAPFPFRIELFADVLRAIAVPTLVLSGETGYRNADHVERVAMIADAREIVLPKVGHMMHWHTPEAFAKAIADHVEPTLDRPTSTDEPSKQESA
jgi:pimeloyl-ACP methyl ester carboxylesterase